MEILAWAVWGKKKKQTEEILAYIEKEIGYLFLCVVCPSYEGISSSGGSSSGLCTGAGKKREFPPGCCYVAALPPGLAREILFTASRTGPRSLCLKEKTKWELIWGYLSHNITPWLFHIPELGLQCPQRSTEPTGFREFGYIQNCINYLKYK